MLKNNNFYAIKVLKIGLISHKSSNRQTKSYTAGIYKEG